MTRAFAFLLMAVTLLAGAYPASAQGDDDFFNFFGRGGSNYRSGPNYGRGSDYYGGGSGPIPRTVVSAPGRFAPGTIYINTAERRLYLILGNGEALRYGIGVGRDGFTWTGVQKISRKAEWPDWHPPTEMIERQPYLPRQMAGGPGNPLGARAMYLGGTVYRIHGTNAPQTIGTRVSSGCIRLTNQDVSDLYSRVSVGTKVIVLPMDRRAENARPGDQFLCAGLFRDAALRWFAGRYHIQIYRHNRYPDGARRCRINIRRDTLAVDA
ncbi:putative L,D-transpeptidase ErfK/SrfK precursor [mine drainage metagenome]|uniref:Putative L,D-transpeptidase ErfK/SrfK n=1 Tax=mine drainage metagenome TaxID=410659 RepID=A0A1J5P419_9ZZZZ